MFVSGKHLLACAILLALGHTITAEYDIASYCSLVKIGQKLPSIDDCQTYYTCGRSNRNKNNEPTYTTSKCDSGEKFDKDTQSCRNGASVSCYIGEESSCVGKDKQHIPVMGTCNQYTWCVNGKAVGSGQCPGGTCFKNGQCENCKSCADNINTSNGGQEFTSVCAIMPPNVYFGSTVECNIYQWCNTADILDHSTCPKGFAAYIAETGQCGYKGADNLNTCLRVTGDDIQPDDDKELPCEAADLNKQKPSEMKCSRYFVCDGSLWKIKNCPNGNYYDIKKKTCVKRSAAQPSPRCNRCEFFKLNRDAYWANTVDPTCQGYVRCDDGKQVGSKKLCSPNEYFNEAAQSCILDSSLKSLENYIELNGACAANGVDCATTCSALAADKCITTGTCKCGFNKGICADCTTASNCDSCKAATDLAKCNEPSNLECYVKDGQCNYCPEGTTAVGNDCEVSGPNNCDCTEHSDLEACVADVVCNCGINDGACADCSAAGSCNQCKESTDLVDCADDTDDTCYLDADDECVYCEEGEKAEDNACVPE